MWKAHSSSHKTLHTKISSTASTALICDSKPSVWPKHSRAINRLVNVVAVTYGNLIALTKNGGLVHSQKREFETQWLRWPILADAMGPMGIQSVPKIETDLVMRMQSLQLDMQFIGTTADCVNTDTYPLQGTNRF